jgi:hypothetical protein
VHTTVIGHSYGSLATGLGLLGSLEPDDAVFVGSPGVGVDNRSQLPGDVRIWAAKAQWDLVPLAPVHGQDPASDEFGALRFRTGDITGHSSYFQTGSESLRNIAHIVVGEPPTRVE